METRGSLINGALAKEGRGCAGNLYGRAGVVRNFGRKSDHTIWLPCSWLSWILLCGIRAFTADILDPHSPNISDQNTHKLEPPKPRSSAVQDHRRSRDGDTS